MFCSNFNENFAWKKVDWLLKKGNFFQTRKTHAVQQITFFGIIHKVRTNEKGEGQSNQKRTPFLVTFFC